MQLEIRTPDEGALVQGAQKAAAIVQAIEIDSPEMLEMAGQELKNIKTRKDALEAQRKDLVQPLNGVVKKINDLFRKPIEILDQAERALKRSMLTYQEREEAKAREAQRQADEAARKQREELERQAREKEEAAQREAAAGNTEAAEQLLQEAQVTAETAQVVTAPVVAAPAPKASGTAMKETWKAEVTDLGSLVKHIGEHPELLNLLTVNQSALNQMAKALKSNLNLPGVRPYPERTLAARVA